LSLDAIRDALTWSRTEGAARLVLVVIAYHADRFTGESYASRRLLAEEANVSKSTVHLALEELLGLGEIEIVVVGVGRRANIYRVLCSDSTIDPLRPLPSDSTFDPLEPVDKPVDNSVVGRSADRSGSMGPSVVGRSARSPIRNRTEEQERFEPESAGAPIAPPDLPADAVGRRSAGKRAVPPAQAASLAALKNGWRARTVEAQQAERDRQRELFGPPPTEGAPPPAVPEPARPAGAYGGYVPTWAADQWTADHPDTDLQAGPSPNGQPTQPAPEE
jgi:hypothetical protein